MNFYCISIYSNVVIFGKYLSVEVWGNIIVDIYFCEVFVVCYEVFREMNMFLKGDCVIVIFCINSFSYMGVCFICFNN